MPARDRLSVPADSQPPLPGHNEFSWELPFPDRAARRRAWRHTMLKDEGLLRLLVPNVHRVSERAWRSAQPSPRQLRRFAARGGRTVVSLRKGRNFGSLPLELEACHLLGLDFRVHVFSSRRLPGAENLLAFDALCREIETPVLFHCKSGADRAGFAAALWLIFAEGRPVGEARRQLALRYGHLASAKTGVLDAFFDAYERDAALHPQGFRDWIATRYDPARIEAGFTPRPLAGFLVDKVLGRE